MIRTFAAKIALAVLGCATLGVVSLATLAVLYVSAEEGCAQQKPSCDRQSSVESFDRQISAVSRGEQDGQPRQYGQTQQNSRQYGQAPRYVQAAYGTEPEAGWTRLVSPDGSATLALPPDWRIAGGAKGSVQTEGPNGQQVILGFQTFVTANQAPYMAPEQALAWFMRSHGVQLDGIQQREPQRTSSGQAELMIGVSEMQGKKYKLVARVTTVQVGMGNWMLQISSMGAPVEQFDTDFPTMRKIWNSWNLDPKYVRNALQAAADTNRQTATMMANGAINRFNSWKPFNESWDQTIRGVSTLENSSEGKRVETPIGSEQQYLNDCVRNGQDCRQVPMSELAPHQ